MTLTTPTPAPASPVLVVFESMFGNTKAIAEAVAAGVRDHAEVEVSDVVGLSPAAASGRRLIIAGGPTHAFSMSRPSTRADAQAHGAASGAAAEGLREWLASIPAASPHQVMATFDTKIDWPLGLSGSAARKAARLAHQHGYPVVDRQHFFVQDKEGPLVEGQLEQARRWGAALAALHAGTSTRQATAPGTS